MAGKPQHVAPRGGKWIVRRTGAARATGVYATQAEAIARARALALHQGTELYIHGSDGRISERDSFGGDTHSSRG